MIDIEFKNIERKEDGLEIGIWLDQHMPNPPLPEPQRWTLGYSNDGRVGIRFENEKDATHFMLRWS